MTTPISDPTPKAALVRAQLRQLIDPELGLNVVDLGLIRKIEVTGTTVTVTMTLTSPGCPMGEVLIEGVRTLVTAIPGLAEVIVHLIWDPPWSPSDLSPAAQEILHSSPSL